MTADAYGWMTKKIDTHISHDYIRRITYTFNILHKKQWCFRKKYRISREIKYAYPKANTDYCLPLNVYVVMEKYWRK
jgi:hypothetical protein